MNANDLISDSWKKQQQIFLISLAKLILNFRNKTIHNLRVAIKKLRCYLGLFNLHKSSCEAGIKMEETEILFNILGKYRDIEIIMKLLNSINTGKKISINI